MALSRFRVGDKVKFHHYTGGFDGETWDDGEIVKINTEGDGKPILSIQIGENSHIRIIDQREDVRKVKLLEDYIQAKNERQLKSEIKLNEKGNARKAKIDAFRDKLTEELWAAMQGPFSKDELRKLLNETFPAPYLLDLF